VSLDAERAEAARVAAHVDLKDVRLWGLQADLESVPNEQDTHLSYNFDADVQVQHHEDHPVLLVIGNYTMAMRAVPADAEGDSDDGEEVASMSFNLNALFIVDREPDEPFTESELNAFGKTTGQVALYPYARELVANLTGRMGLPALHMGVMRLNLDSRDG
jgi:hypothetical protein